MTELFPINDEAKDKEQDIQYRIDSLCRELNNFANLSPRFKKGRADSVSISVGEGERIDPEPDDYEPVSGEYDDEEEYDEIDSAVPVSEFTYEFKADRLRRLERDGNEVRQRAWVGFMFSVMGVQHNVLMPGNLAEDSIGLPPQEATREVGLVTYKTTTQFSLTTEFKNFAVCESSVYLDLDGDPFNEMPCSCENNVVAYVPLHEADDEGDLLDLSDISIQQLPSSDLLAKSQNEIVEYVDAEKAVDEWRDMQHIGQQLDLDIRYERVMRAQRVLKNIQTAIWTQAGLTPRQQRTLRLKLRNS